MATDYNILTFHQHHRPQDRRPPRYASSSSIPSDIAHAANGRPILRVKNIHHDLNGEDLSNLFSGVATVEFIKFDPQRDTVAYVCFETDNTENNAIAISKFDGKKAMGKLLIVENATSLADRIIAAPKEYNRAPREYIRAPRPQHPKRRPARKPKPVKKSIDDLDDELSAYMNNAQES